MRRKDILEVPLKVPREKGGKQVTVQVLNDRYLLLDLWEDSENRCRHAVEIHTGEYGTYYPGTDRWTGEQLNTAAEGTGSWYWMQKMDEKEWKISEDDRTLIKNAVGTCSWNTGAYYKITDMEDAYSRKKRWGAAERKRERLEKLMDSLPEPGKAVRDWIAGKAAGDLQYAFYDKEKKTFHCTACRGDFAEKAAGVKTRDRDRIRCPLCGHGVTASRRKKNVTLKTRLTLIQNVDGKQGVERHFQVEIEWREERKLFLEETIRLMMLRNGKKPCRIYYADTWGDWTEGNRANRRWKPGFLYPDRDGIREGLRGTEYEAWTDVLSMLAEAGAEADYNGLLVESNRYWVRTAEYLLKGRFYRLLKEESAEITTWGGYLGSTLRPGGETIEEVMNIRDRQLVNRLRQENGGRNMLEWLQWSGRTGKRISTECLEWYGDSRIGAGTYQRSRAGRHLSPEQLMNYIRRQQAEGGYRKMKAKNVLEQYEDYLDMAEQLGKHMDDEMVYRPRELKRRHDEAAGECSARKEELMRKRNAEAARKQAEQMRQKYPGYEDILEEIRKKLEFGDDTYRIVVPCNFMEITAEGMALHHCVGNTERYFDRIMSRETYICFLRQQSSPETPFYTIEVEPGGTIRQHRGAYDEEPGIEEIKPFLRKWQKEIRKRMGRKDHEYARRSGELRRKNILELEEKNNTRVLNGLMEDLMEAEGEDADTAGAVGTGKGGETEWETAV